MKKEIDMITDLAEHVKRVMESKAPEDIKKMFLDLDISLMWIMTQQNKDFKEA